MEEHLEKIVKSINQLDGKYSYTEIFYDWVKCMAYSFANSIDSAQEREGKFLKIKKKYTEEQFQQFHLCTGELIILFEKEINDYLGKIYHILELHNKAKGQFFTPFHISKAIGMINTEEVEKKLLSEKKVIVTDFACGSGSLILGLINSLEKKKYLYKNKLYIDCVDLDENCILMSYVQLTLSDIKARCRHGNAITEEIFNTYHTVTNIL